VWAEGLPAGVTVERQMVQPKDTIVKDTCGVERVVDGSIVLLPLRVEGASTGTFDLRIKARGVRDGRTVEHEALVRYNHNSVGLLYGPMQVQRAQLTVSEAPEVLVTAADSVIAGAQTTPVKLGIRRFGAAKQTALIVRPKALPAGIRAGEVKVPASVKEATLQVVGDAPAEGARIVLEVVSEADGKVIGESAPILIEARK